MDEATGSSNAIPPFLTKTYEMIDDPSTNSIVSWSVTNRSFVVWNPPEFSRDLLPTFFKHNNFSSFIRQLNTYGFRKIDPEQWEFANDEFIRGQPQLLKNIHRRKPVHSHSLQNQYHGIGSSSPLTQSERQGLKEDIQRLKHEKESLLSEIQIHEFQSREIQMQLNTLLERLQRRNQKQQEMMTRLSQILHKPGLALNLSPLHDRKRRIPRSDESSVEDNEIPCNLLTLAGENLGFASGLVASTSEQFELLENSVIFWETLLGEFLKCHSEDCEKSPSISYLQLEVQSKPSSIDMNSEPPAMVQKDVAVNDLFWEQFLTENPSSSQGKDWGERKIESENGKMWWGARNVGNVSGQLAPAGKT